MRIGVIGIGVVGKAVADAFQERGLAVARWDKYKPEFADQVPVLLSEVCFVCVPTPSTPSGEQDLTALEQTMAFLSARSYCGTIVIKSTVVPGTTERLSAEYGLRKVCHNPEFLTAARPFKDFLEQPAILIGSSSQEAAIECAEAYFSAQFQNVRMARSPRVTEMAKYYHNLFLAVKVGFANEMSEACAKAGVDYDRVRDLACEMNGVGRGHTSVPGPDGELGFGGMCFPKDTSAFLRWALKEGLPAETLEATVRANKRRRDGA